MCISWGSDGLEAGRPQFGSQQGQISSLPHSFQTLSGTHKASYSMVTTDSLRWVKAVES
jgi:hypothetical protein